MIFGMNSAKHSTAAVATVTVTSPVRVQVVESRNPLYKLTRKNVFLDLENNTSSLKDPSKLIERVKVCLTYEKINAKIADCLSKEVDFVITNRDNNNNNNNNNNSNNHQQETTPNEIQNNEFSLKTIKTTTSSAVNSLTLSSRTTSLINRHQPFLVRPKEKIDTITTARRLGIAVIYLNEIDRYIADFLKRRKSSILNNDPKENESLLINSPTSLTPTTTTTTTTILTNSNDSRVATTAELVVVGVPQFSPAIMPKSCNKHKICRLKAPFLKFESICKTTRPIYQEFKVWHDLDLEFDKNTSPFGVFFSDEQHSSSADNNNNQPKKSLLRPEQQHCLKPTAKITPNSLKMPKKKPLGYCECCKVKYDCNLQQHLASAQHETFEKNGVNFKELDEYVLGELSFEKFLNKNNLNMKKNAAAELDELKELARAFKEKRQSLGLSQSQVLNEINRDDENEPLNVAETALINFENLLITPRSGAKMKPVLQCWLSSAKLKFGDRINESMVTIEEQEQPQQQQQQQQSTNLNESISKKRKRFDKFSPRTIETLTEAHKKHAHPDERQLNDIASHLDIDRHVDMDLLRSWFSERGKQNNANKTKKYKHCSFLNSQAILNNMTNNMSNNSDNSQTENNETPPEDQITTTPLSPTTACNVTDVTTTLSNPKAKTRKDTPPLTAHILTTRKSIATNRLATNQNSININAPSSKQYLSSHLMISRRRSSLRQQQQSTSSFSMSSPTAAAMLFNMNNTTNSNLNVHPTKFCRSERVRNMQSFIFLYLIN
jgi:hypothetical protein